MHFGDIIKKRRKSLRITQDTLAEVSGIGLRTLKQLELDKGNPTLDTLEKIANVLGLELILQVKSMDKNYETSEYLIQGRNGRQADSA